MNKPDDPGFEMADSEGQDAQSTDDENVEMLEETVAIDHGDDSAESKLKDAEERAIRLQAELENFRRRKARETQEQIKFAATPMVSSLLEVVDNLERALTAAAESAEEDAPSTALRQGVEMVANQLQSVLENHGCKRIDAVGQPFDPNLHEAIQMHPSDTIPANHVMHEVQTGYTLHDRVVRPSKVMVSTGPA